MKNKTAIIFIILWVSHLLLAQNANVDKYWSLSNSQSIVWKLNKPNYPHEDNIEMSGKLVSSIIYYKINDNKEVEIYREIFFPQLTTIETDWRIYRAYRKLNYSTETEPSVVMKKKKLEFRKTDSVSINGKLIFYHTPVKGIVLKRTLFPSMNKRVFVENWEFTNTDNKSKELQIGETNISSEVLGVKGKYINKVHNDAARHINILPNASYSFTIYFSATIENEPQYNFSYVEIEKERDVFIQSMKENLVLETSDPVLNQLFYFSKIRASENIFDSKMGLVHSPGGGNYYIGIWANDQVEYSGPFFPFLGYNTGVIAAKNAYSMFLRNIPENFEPISSSFEVDGDLPCCNRDRGDAAMISYGASQFLLRNADKEFAMQLFPLIEWSINYCEKMKNSEGIVMSTTDEMEGRITTGDANLSTNSLYYGGLKNASYLAKELGYDSLSDLYQQRSVELYHNIEKYFGYELEGLNTYRYFKGNTHLRHWICLPLVMDINTRAEATSIALLEKLWTSNGVLVEYNPDSKEPNVFWDRGTLYALRGTFKAGFFDKSLEKLMEYSNKRLLGSHVPYAIEAYPENNMKHLSAESALFCRLIIEGMLSFEQTAFNSFSIKPQLSEKLNRLNIKNLFIGKNNISIHLNLQNAKIETKVIVNGVEAFNKMVSSGEKVEIKF